MSTFTNNTATAADFSVVIVAGLSGAGKSTALNVFEDMRFFTMDGLPGPLLPELTRLLTRDNLRHFNGLALGVNLLQSDFIREYGNTLSALREQGITPMLLFTEAQPEALMRRYATTRRPHPLESEGLGLEQALEEERGRLIPVRDLADLIIDTSDYSIHDLRRVIQGKWQSAQEHAHTLKVHLVSFGFKYGTPSDADLVFDLRFLPNPYFVPELKAFSGLDKPVADYVLGQEPGHTFRRRTTDYLLYMLPLYEAEGRYRITIGIGCTGGRHRSVAFTESLSRSLTKRDFAVSTEHRHLELG